LDIAKQEMDLFGEVFERAMKEKIFVMKEQNQ
jgi:hypothetical protein